MTAYKESKESRELVNAAFDLARSLAITKLLVQANTVRDVRLVEKRRQKENIIWLSKGSIDLASRDLAHRVIDIPETSSLSRMSQIKIGLFLAVLNGYLELEESILCLSGVAGTERLDTLLIANPKRDFPWFSKHDAEETRKLVASRAFARILDIALRLSTEGREGRPIGTIFVVGDQEQLAPHLRQLVLNPLEGHPKSHRSIHNPYFLETIRELAAMDGAFLISKTGTVETAGTFLAPPVHRGRLRPGLGARHAAAAGVTASTDAIALVISESSGTITVFHEGNPILELEKPMPHPRRLKAKTASS
jgi:DNA integrity scanning protein DisA with diadenylate cyclase activity